MSLSRSSTAMSNGGMGTTPDPGDDTHAPEVTARHAADGAAGHCTGRNEAALHSADSGRRRRQALLALMGVVLPLLVFALLAYWQRERGAPSFDLPVMQAVHAWVGPHTNGAVLWISHLGYSHGVVPFGLVFVIVLLARRRWREGLYVLLALGGALWLNGLLKAAFARPRPDLWEPLWRYSGYSFPSGHAAATAALTMVLALLAWRTRWRVAVLGLMVPFTLLVGISRPYMGVHYPSDVLAGWAFGCAWAAGCYLVAFHRYPPWHYGAQASG